MNKSFDVVRQLTTSQTQADGPELAGLGSTSTAFFALTSEWMLLAADAVICAGHHGGAPERALQMPSWSSHSSPRIDKSTPRAAQYPQPRQTLLTVKT